MFRRAVLAAVAILVAGVVVAEPVVAQDAEDAGVHQPGVDALRALDVFDGTGCDDGGGLCPREPLKRWEMAVWLVRVLEGEEPPEVTESRFADVAGDVWWAAHTERLAELAVTRGCASEPLRFCPDRVVNRGQMAAFLVRAFGLSQGPPAGFTDVAADHTFATDIDALAAARVTVGCAGDPPRYCPGRGVTRREMATFLARAIGLIEAPIVDEGDAGSLASGEFHSCALRPGGSIQCWGDIRNGQTDAPEGTFDAVAAGGFHSCARRTDGTIICWGDNLFGQADAPGGMFESVAAGGFHSCGLRSGGTVVCWGDNGDGQADAPGGMFESVAAGGFHSCGLRSGGTVVCWGDNGDGQADAPGGMFESVAAGGFHSCGLRSGGTVVCWGDNGDGQADAPGGMFESVAAGGFHSCGLRSGGTVVCWGDNQDGRAAAPLGEFEAVSAGASHSCALRTDRALVCWGSNEHGQVDAPG